MNNNKIIINQRMVTKWQCICYGMWDRQDKELFECHRVLERDVKFRVFQKKNQTRETRTRLDCVCINKISTRARRIDFCSHRIPKNDWVESGFCSARLRVRFISQHCTIMLTSSWFYLMYIMVWEETYPPHISIDIYRCYGFDIFKYN